MVVMFLFKDRLTRHERGKFIVIQDSLELYGCNLMKGIVKIFSKEGTSICILCCDHRHKDDWENASTFGANLQVIDHYSDPCGWNTGVITSDDHILYATAQEMKSKQDSVLVIDSLSTLLFRSTAEKLYRTLCSILSGEESNVQILALLHEDAHSKETVRLLSTLSTCTLSILPSSNGNSVLSCVSHHCRGKILHQVVQYQMEENFDLRFVCDMPEAKDIQPVVKHPDPTANLTFNLRLKDTDKEVRSKLQLPYMKTSPEVPEVLNEDDFYDEDDPDDDLDI